MGKTFIALDEKEQIMVERICLDKDPQEALAFVMQVIAPRIKKPIPCLAGELMKPRG